MSKKRKLRKGSDMSQIFDEATLRGGKDLIASMTIKCTPELRETMNALAKLDGDEGSLSTCVREACITFALEHYRVKQLYDKAFSSTTDTVDTRSNGVRR